MSWKRNVFGCLMWVIYLLIVGTAMLFTGRVICDTFGMAEYCEIAVPAGYLLLTGILVFVLHRMAVKLEVSSRSRGKGLLWMEGIVVLALFAAGLFLRVTGMQSVSHAGPENSAYLELSYISTDGQGIPQFAHGAMYLYLWALRLCFILLGNKAIAAVGLQIGLQMLSVCLLYFAVRKMAGKIPAVMMLAFFMLSPFMVDKAFLLSPEMLYLLFFSFVLLLVSQGAGAIFGWGFWLIVGVLTAALCYLDVAGFLLLPLMPGVIAMRRQGVKQKIVRGLSGCLPGFLLGAGGCILADMASSGKSLGGIVYAWTELYQWGDLQLSVTFSSFNTLCMITLILCFMAWGVFSFWCGRGVERFSIWIFCLSVAVTLQILGIFTEEMNGYCYIFFFSTILAGLGLRESMVVYPVEESERKAQEDKVDGVDAEVPPETDASRDDADVEVQPEIDMSRESADAEVPPEADASRDGVDAEVPPEADASRDDADVEVPPETDTSRDDADHEVQSSKEKEKMTGEKGEAVEEKETVEKPKIEFIENPLPLPKKHEKRVMDYTLEPGKDLDGYDVFVSDDDDFDH